MAMRRLTQEVLIHTIEVAESLRDRYLTDCQVVEGLAKQLLESTIRDAILQIVTDPKYSISEEISYISIERVRVNITRGRNDYLRRRRAAAAEALQPMTDDDLDGFPASLPSDQFVDDEPESPGENK